MTEQHEVVLDVATEADAELLSNLLELYIHDLSAVFPSAEFFVLRRYRRASVGRRAAVLLWRRLPGTWIVRVAEANRGALVFWARVIAAFAGGAAVETRRPGEPHSWRAYSFDSARMRPSGPS